MNWLKICNTFLFSHLFIKLTFAAEPHLENFTNDTNTSQREVLINVSILKQKTNATLEENEY